MAQLALSADTIQLRTRWVLLSSRLLFSFAFELTCVESPFPQRDCKLKSGWITPPYPNRTTGAPSTLVSSENVSSFDIWESTMQKALQGRRDEKKQNRLIFRSLQVWRGKSRMPKTKMKRHYRKAMTWGKGGAQAPGESGQTLQVSSKGQCMAARARWSGRVKNPWAHECSRGKSQPPEEEWEAKCERQDFTLPQTLRKRL